MTTKTKVVFFIIMGLALVLVAGVFIGENVVGFTLPTRGGILADIRVAVAPSLEAWVREAANEFNNQNPQLTVEVVSLRGLDADRRLSTSGVDDVLDAWIADADFIRDMAGNIPYDMQGKSVAQTRLIWLAKNSYLGLQGVLDWETVHEAAVDVATWQALSNGDFQFDVALPSPSNSVAGLAAYLSAAASYHNQPDLDNSPVTDPQYLNWMNEILAVVPEKTRSPFEQFSRPPVSIDVGILLESEVNQLGAGQFIQQPPKYNVILNYPYLVRHDDALENAANRVTAAQQFGDFLLSDEQQQKLAQFGFSTANDTNLGQSIRIDGKTAGTLWNRVK